MSLMPFEDLAMERKLRLKREHAHRVWGCLHMLACVVNAYEAGACDGYGAHLPPGWVDALRIDNRNGYGSR